MFKKPMKMRDLEVWGVPSYMVDIWEKNYSPYLLPVQEKAVRYYGVLDKEGRIPYAPTGGMDSRGRVDEIAALPSVARNDKWGLRHSFRREKGYLSDGRQGVRGG